MSPSRMKLDDFISAVRLAVDNTLEHPEMLAAVQPYGYDEDGLNAIRAELLLLKEAAAYRRNRKGLQIGATATLNEARDQFRASVYSPHLTIARVTFSGDAAMQARLGLRGNRSNDFDIWLGQARTFYDNALADPTIVEALSARGVQQADLSAARARLTELGGLDSTQENKKGLAQQATRDRNAIRKNLVKWLSDYRRIARIAFRDNPEWLERIGVRHRSTPA